MAALEAQLGAERRRADETDAERRSLQESVEVLHRQLRETSAQAAREEADIA